MKKLKTVNIKGKEYVEVNTRLQHFREVYPQYTLDTDIVEITEDTITMKAIILNEEGRLIASGTAKERSGSSFINKTSYVENCETSAWGRALGNFGIGLDTSVASYDEVANAIKNQETKVKPPAKTTKLQLVIEDDNWAKVLKYMADNKALGLDKLVSNLEQKYNIKASVKKELSKHLK
tara:strand:- start:6493 stop:7029 length:537 start_codon:yes stop_codon:yes gene_type:complete